MYLCVYAFMYLCVDVFVYSWKNTNVDLWFYGIVILWVYVNHSPHYQSHSSFTDMPTCSSSLVLSVRIGSMQYFVFVPAFATVPCGTNV